MIQLFQNLLDNAIKFRSEVPLRVSVSSKEHDLYWRFSIKDNGIGIDPKKQDRIFGMFQRLHAQDEHPGSGMGLALCRRIVARHGGRIWVKSKRGRGTTFLFTLAKNGGSQPGGEQ